jgi:hypothetical protein
MKNITTLKDLAVNHSYYCNLANYYSNSALLTYDNFEQFLEEWGDADMDYNLCFRWDVKESENDNGEMLGTYKMEVFIMGQRKGKFTPIFIEQVLESDVPAIVKYLTPYAQYLKDLWKPF